MFLFSTYAPGTFDFCQWVDGVPVEFVINPDVEHRRCGLHVDFGDGESRDVKIEPSEELSPHTLAKSDGARGVYA